MDFLGVGPLELFFIVLLALIIFGPNDVVKAARSLGRFMRKVVTSDTWRIFQQTSKGIQNLPTVLMREAGLEDQDLSELTGLSEVERLTKDINRQINPWLVPGASAASKMKIPQPGGDPIVDTPSDDEAATLAAWLGSGAQVEPSISPSQRGVAEPSAQPTAPKTAPPPDAPFTEIIDEGDLTGDA